MTEISQSVSLLYENNARDLLVVQSSADLRWQLPSTEVSDGDVLGSFDTMTNSVLGSLAIGAQLITSHETFREGSPHLNLYYKAGLFRPIPRLQPNEHFVAQEYVAPAELLAQRQTDPALQWVLRRLFIDY